MKGRKNDEKIGNGRGCAADQRLCLSVQLPFEPKLFG
jgi:hypothetical protein